MNKNSVQPTIRKAPKAFLPTRRFQTPASTFHKVLPRLTSLFASVFIAATAQATLFDYFANLDGPSESPANASPGIGYATFEYNDVAHTLQLQVTFSGLTGPTTASHIHAPTPTPFSGTAGVATTTPYFAGFPIGVTSGSYSNTLDLTQSSSYNPSYVSANGGSPATAEVALTSAIAAGKSYLNIHSQTFPGGEIRGFLTPIPEPSTAVLLGLGALAWIARRSKAA